MSMVSNKGVELQESTGGNKATPGILDFKSPYTVLTQPQNTVTKNTDRDHKGNSTDRVCVISYPIL